MTDEHVGEPLSKLKASLGALIKPLAALARELGSRKRYFGYARAHLWGLRLMSALGWFIQEEDGAALGNQIWQLFSSGQDLEVIDAYLLENTKGQAVGILDEAATEWPHRAEHFDRAKTNFMEGQWIEAILLLLAQADGVTKEIFGRNRQLFYGKLSSRKKAIRDLRSSQGQAGAIMFWWAVYGDPTKWHKPTDPRFLRFLTKTAPGLAGGDLIKKLAGHTRHAILHGEALDYGTERTALQAVSLVGYCVLLRRTAENAHNLPSGHKKTP